MLSRALQIEINTLYMRCRRLSAVANINRPTTSGLNEESPASRDTRAQANDRSSTSTTPYKHARRVASLAFVAHELVAREACEALRAAVEAHDGLLQMDR